MELIITWYALGALLVSVMSLIDLYHPVVNMREMSMDIRVLHYITWFFIGMLVAPALIYPCVSSLKGIEFRDALDKALFGR